MTWPCQPFLTLMIAVRVRLAPILKPMAHAWLRAGERLSPVEPTSRTEIFCAAAKVIAQTNPIRINVPGLSAGQI